MGKGRGIGERNGNLREERGKGEKGRERGKSVNGREVYERKINKGGNLVKEKVVKSHNN